MTVEEVSRLAINGFQIPDSEPYEDRCLWYELTDIYRKYRQGQYNQEDGQTAKSQAVRRYQLAVSQGQLSKEILERNGKLYRDIESAATECRKNPCKDTALRLLDAIYGSGTSEGAISLTVKNNQ